ncbi:MAG: transposase [Lentimicrobiaceae bacterium]
MIPWDEICNIYLKHIDISSTSRPPKSFRIVIGSLILKHPYNLHDQETIDHISENLYMQYFLRYPCFSDKAPSNYTLLMEFRKRLGIEWLNAINERIVALKASY